MRSWFSGRTPPCQGGDKGPIPFDRTMSEKSPRDLPSDLRPGAFLTDWGEKHARGVIAAHTPQKGRKVRGYTANNGSVRMTRGYYEVRERNRKLTELKSLDAQIAVMQPSAARALTQNLDLHLSMATPISGVVTAVR